jgi:hypothetical protein
MSKGRMFLPGNEAQMNDTSSRRDSVRSLRIVSRSQPVSSLIAHEEKTTAAPRPRPGGAS